MGTTAVQEVKKELTHSERFTNKVMQEFQGNVSGGLKLTDYQRQLVQGYFIGIDRALKLTDEKRIRDNKNNSDHNYDNVTPVTWDNVNINDLALDVVHYARMGLDMMEKNHISPIPFKNKKTNKYYVNLMPGYAGIQYIAERYALDKPLDVTIELVYTNDFFKPIKKSVSNKIEGYEFEITSPFDRGDIIGGFGYISFSDPTKNKLITLSREQIEKRKPKTAAAEFWGGTKDEWKNGKKTGNKVEVEGWFEEMCLKTIKREVYSPKHIPRDPKKIDDDYQYMKAQETKIASLSLDDEIRAHGNKAVIDIDEFAELPPDEHRFDEQPNIPGQSDENSNDEQPEADEFADHEQVSLAEVDF